MKQPEGNVYLINEVPGATPVTTPVVDPTVATVVVMLVQKPPRVEDDSPVVWPWHTDIVPVIGNGFAFTVTTITRAQVVPNVYVIGAVPKFNPVTIPVPAPTLAFRLAVVQVPPGLVGSVKATVPPIQTVGAAGNIAPGNGFTVKIAVVEQPAPKE